MEKITREECVILAMPRTVTVCPAVFPYTVHFVLDPICKPIYTEASSRVDSLGRCIY
jgi:hypothetical protein